MSQGSSAWEQWGGKKPAGGALQGATDAFQSLMRGSPLSTASTASSTDSDAGSSSGASFSLKKVWDSARDLTKNATSGGSSAVAAAEADAMENGEADELVDEGVAVRWPLWRKDSTAAQTSIIPAMSWNTRFKYFVAMALLGLLFFGMASIFIPLIVIRPSKFALSFTLGSMCCMGAVAMLKGPAAYLSGLLQPNRLLLTTAYFVTLGSTLYSCLVLGNYVFVVLSSVLQLMTLGTFALSAFPGGNKSLKAFGSLFWKSARSMVQAFARLFR